MSCTTQPFLHRIALGKCTLLVPNSPWDLISAPLPTVHNLSVHFKTFQTNSFAYKCRKKGLGKGAPATAESGDPNAFYGKPTFQLLFHIIFRKKQSPYDNWTTGQGLQCCFLLVSKKKPLILTYYGLCFLILEEPLCVIPEGNSNVALLCLAVLLRWHCPACWDPRRS